ncbi:type II secretion system protein N [Marinobacter caseinilyticus]|uniref:type II secretion system protein N n=1 Tax=Marinobacter caseinilyticus TaxID=2692195 RepID=UPI00140A42E1|nr:type II secretion system protein N [Marinobacter caseinilyticus]
MPRSATAATIKWSRRLANGLLLGLVIYFAIFMAHLTWMVAWHDRPVSLFSPSSGADTLGFQRQGSLATYELFGRPPSGTPVAAVVRKTAPETRLRLRLEGVLVSGQPELSGAIVAGSDGVTAHYRVGETLPGNAELVEVEAGRILIRRNGAFETLTFEDSDAGELIAQEETVTGPSPDDIVEQAKARLDEQGTEALVAFGLSPVQDGATQGYVFNGSNAMLTALSLRQGDVITAINGNPLGDFEQDRALLESWRTEAQLDIEIERDGARFTVSYALPQ